MGELSFQNNVPDPLLAKKELPSFKFELEKSTGRVTGNSFGKEATTRRDKLKRTILRRETSGTFHAATLTCSNALAMS